ncbi:MAG: hypothetical protein KGI70_02750 [Patescibacteria group bacterium]|nr:hypothetical protein [Patescibacteria group bacterium]
MDKAKKDRTLKSGRSRFIAARLEPVVKNKKNRATKKKKGSSEGKIPKRLK